MTYTLGSLFSGIGGIDLAFELAGFDIAFQVEIDGYCNRVLDRHWPAGLGQEQHEWEPPRTVPSRSVKNRSARLKALGNAVVPQVVYPIAVEIRRALELMDGEQ